MGGDLPRELTDFITRHLVSVEQLEVLLLLHRHPEKVWTVAALSRELRGNEAAISQWLNNLVSTSLVEAVGDGYRFQATSGELTARTELLAAIYRERMVRVIEFLYARPASQLVDFSDAFKFRKRS